jgi:tetratricopeptide (TPR) repeat protein
LIAPPRVLSPRTRPLALAYKARNFTALNRRSESIAAAEAAAELNPTDAQTLDNLGVVFTRAGLHERAAPYYERATAVQGTPGRFYNLGAALQFLGRFEDARAAYSKCIAMCAAPRTGMVEPHPDHPRDARDQ